MGSVQVKDKKTLFLGGLQGNDRKKDVNSRLMLIASMTIFGTLGIFVRNISVSSGELALYRAVLAALLIAVFLLLTKQRIPFSKIKKQVPLLLASGIAMGFNWIFLFEAYKYTTVSIATLSYYFAPVIVTIVCPIIFKEKAIMKLCEICEISIEDIVAFGDDLVDIGMLQLCGKGIAMGNALQEVKNIADIVIGTNDEEATAEWLEEYYND